MADVKKIKLRMEGIYSTKGGEMHKKPMKMAVCWAVEPCSQGDAPDDGGSKHL
jgi:hypothetical protein